jgi:hypothetical protein
VNTLLYIAPPSGLAAGFEVVCDRLGAFVARRWHASLLHGIVNAAGDKHNGAVLGEIGDEEPRQQIVPEVIDRERRLETVDRRSRRRDALQAGIADQPGQRRQSGASEGGCECAHGGERSEVERQHARRSARALQRLRRLFPPRDIATGEHDQIAGLLS